MLFNSFALSYSYHSSNVPLYHLFEEVGGERQNLLKDSVCGLNPPQVVLPGNLMGLNIKQSYEATITLIPKPDKDTTQGFPGGAVVKNLPANARDTDSSPGPGRSHMPWSN